MTTLSLEQSLDTVVARPTWRGWLFAALFGLSALCLWQAAMGISLVVGLVGLAFLPRWKSALSAWPVLIWLLALLVWGAISMQWSPVVVNLAKPGQIQILKLAVMFLAYVPLVFSVKDLDEADLNLAGTAMTWSVFLLCGLILIDIISHDGLTQFIRGLNPGPKLRPDLVHKKIGQAVYYPMLLLWPVAEILWVREQKRDLLILVIATFLLPFAFDINAVTLSVLLGGAVLVAMKFMPRVTPKLGAIAIVPVVLSSIFVVLWADQAGVIAKLKHHLPESWDQRLDIWNWSSHQAAQKLWTGHGMDSARTFVGKIPLHTHDFAIQLWLELGFLGALFGGLFWAFLFWREHRAIPLAMAVVFLFISAVSFGVWQEWWIALGILGLVGTGISDRLAAIEKAKSDALFMSPDFI